MKTFNINKLYIGKNREGEFRLGMFVKNEPILHEILIDRYTISLSEKGLIVDPSLQLSEILFSDYDKEERNKVFYILYGFEVSERLISQWAIRIKTDKQIIECLDRLSDRDLAGFRKDLEKFLKKELLHDLLFDYTCAIESEKNLNNEPRLGK